MIRTAFSIGAVLALGGFVYDCKPGAKKPPPEEPPPVVNSAVPVPQVMPVDTFDASLEPVEGKTPLEQAKIYESRGQLWMAQMSLEKKALGPDGTRSETEFLAWICHQREEDECLAKCEAKLGKRLKFDGGAPLVVFDAGREHKEPASDLARARDHVLKKEWKEAHEILAPRVLEGKPSKEEIRLLKQVCQHEGDRMCVALCDAKLR
jgi:hypothetical protein